IPFGMNSMELEAWLYYGGGLELWRELYAPFNLYPIPCGNTGVQMGGWFNKEINSIDDLKGLKMRIPGLGGEVLRRAGGTPITLPGAEIFTSLQTGAIDATEWVGPYNDVSFGLHKAAKYYYYPGWQEPGPGLEAIINIEAWNSLPPDLQSILEVACQSITSDMAAEYSHGNANSLKQVMDDPEIDVREFPAEVLQHLKRITRDVVEEMMARDPAAEKIGKAFYAYLEKQEPNSRVTEQAFLATRDG
ncbi:MAG: TRAP transporter substrate-binding protein, partial [Pseudomonadota bacterium]